MSVDDLVIEVAGLGKAYKLYPSKWVKLREWLLPSTSERYQHKWVLRGLSFRVRRGESVGIVGQNGAGKSTLLKILTGTTAATEGAVTLHGSMAALLELGMGFHGEFSGRQNVYMAGQLLGHSIEALDAVMDEIIAFAEIGDYFDAPVRTYSSGMQVRLAFSVATAFRPDVLIVDEALAVGDVYFQHKCYARIRQFKELGTTLLFVSHDPGAVKNLCDRAILLSSGKILMDGRPDNVLDCYNALIAEREHDRFVQESANGNEYTMRSGNGKATILQVAVGAEGQSRRLFRVGEAMTLSVRFRLNEPLPEVTIGFMLKDRLGNEIFGTNTWHLGLDASHMLTEPGEHLLRLEIPALNIGPGSYSVTVALHHAADHVAGNYDWWDRCEVFEVVPHGGPSFVGVAALQVNAELDNQAVKHVHVQE